MKQKINVYVFLLEYHTSDKKKHDVIGGIPLKRLLQWVTFGPRNQIHLIWNPGLPITWKKIIR